MGGMSLGKDEESSTILWKLSLHMVVFYGLYFAMAAAIAAGFPGYTFTGMEPFAWDVDPTGDDGQKVCVCVFVFSKSLNHTVRLPLDS